MRSDSPMEASSTPAVRPDTQATWRRCLLVCVAFAGIGASLPAAAARCYVNGGASGANTGVSWANAYTNLQSALLNASCSETWVAQGLYKPVVPVNIGSVTLAERAIAFNIAPNVAVYGGFSGGETNLTERDAAAHPTILSGDIDNNDDSNNADGNSVNESHTDISGSNSRHVVVMNGTAVGMPISANTVLDGFTLTGGDNTNAGQPTEAGGALWCRGDGATHDCSPTLARLTVSGNRALNGGGIAFIGAVSGASSPTLTHIMFRGNRATSQFGGAMYIYAEASGTSSPKLAHATFSDNSSAQFGGAIANNPTAGGIGSPTLTNVTFIGNSAIQGGAVFNNADQDSSPAFTSVTFTGNSAGFGGAMYNAGAGLTVTLNNVILWGDSAVTSGAEIFDSAAVSVINWGIVSGSCPNNCSNLVTGDPLLGPLAGNGGLTPTLMPAAGSAAINAVPCYVALATDQRAFARPDPASAAVANPCDLGAVEAGSFDWVFGNGFDTP